jgi:hypothetical protein
VRKGERVRVRERDVFPVVWRVVVEWWDRPAKNVVVVEGTHGVTCLVTAKHLRYSNGIHLPIDDYEENDVKLASQAPTTLLQ